MSGSRAFKFSPGIGSANEVCPMIDAAIHHRQNITSVRCAEF
jgi:hypothetical protein